MLISRILIWWRAVLSKKQLDPETEERTLAVGLFNYAESYARAADALVATNVKSTHPDAPVSFLYYHAIELYLKALLRAHGETVFSLTTEYGHNIAKLRKRSTKLGLKFTDPELEVLTLMAKTQAVIESRYIRTGYFHVPKTSALQSLCQSLRQGVGTDLKRLGHRVRF